MIDFTQHRHSAIQAYELGEPDRLLNLLAKNSLNAMEREFVAGILKASVPKGSTGPEKRFDKPVKAALVWYWRHEIDKYPKDAAFKEIEILLGIKLSMARKYLAQIENPKTEGEGWARFLAQRAVEKRRQAVEWGDDELIKMYRERDFAPIARE